MADLGICAADGCDKPAHKNRWAYCSMHEARFRRGGKLERRVERQTFDQITSGQTQYGLWTVLGEGEPYRRKGNGEAMRQASCRCVCGAERLVPIHILKRGMSRHCGCQVSRMVSEMKTTHGLSNTSEYGSWAHLKERCINPNCKDYPDYGGRGIEVCEAWRDSFEAFYADMGAKPSPGHSIDRIDVNGNYEPGNCRWADSITQANNKRAHAIGRRVGP